MYKKVLAIFGIMFVAMLAGFVYMTTHQPETDATKEETEKKEAMPISVINNIELYVTDYVYDANINGYKYTKLDIVNPNEVKGYLKDVDLNDTVKAVVYGKYKMVLDDKTIFFDLDNDDALYFENDVTFKLPNNIKRQIVYTSDQCSCCTTTTTPDACKINLCPCNTIQTSNQNPTTDQATSNQTPTTPTTSNQTASNQVTSNQTTSNQVTSNQAASNVQTPKN